MHRSFSIALAGLACAAMANARAGGPTPAPALLFSPTEGIVFSGTSITITPVGGAMNSSATYVCTPPAGVTVSNNVGSIGAQSGPRTMAVSCPMGVSDGAMQCTHTGSTGSTPSPIDYTIDCPNAGPTLSSVPAAGTTLFCDGAVGAIVTTQATIQAVGADIAGLACSVTGTGFALQTPPSATITAGNASNAVVSCTVPAIGRRDGALICTSQSPAGGTVGFPLSSAGNFVELPLAISIPTNSAWSMLGLIGVLTALGVLMLALRRKG